MAQVLTTSDVISRLIVILERMSEGEIQVPRDDVGPDSIRRLGLDSLATLNFLIAVQNEFGIDWDDDLPEEIWASFSTMAEYILKELGCGV